ncbi:MAG: NAD(P)-dependent oxidoreductase [Candidatus Sulfomarinibacteraceae bacterium]
MRVLLTHNPEDLEAYYGRALPELESMVEVVRNPAGRDLDTAELIEAAANCDVIVAHRSTPGERAVFAQLPALLAFLRTAVDISSVDVDAASEYGVLVARADKSFVPSTAELALGLMIAAARNIGASAADYQAGREPPQRAGLQLAGKTAGIIGYGAIGSYLAPILHALGMSVLVHDPAVATIGDRFEDVGLTELLRRSDVVLPLAPASDETKNLIGAEALAIMKTGALLVNVSRGELVDEAAVADALDSGRLGGFAMDVGRAPDQRPPLDLARRPGVVATPHLGGLTPENADAQAHSSVEQVRAMLEHVMPPRSVNPERAERLRRYWNQ